MAANADAGLSPYERARLENIRRNQEMYVHFSLLCYRPRRMPSTLLTSTVSALLCSASVFLC